MADGLLDLFENKKSAVKIIKIKKYFGIKKPTSYRILNVKDIAAAVSIVIVDVEFEYGNGTKSKNIEIRTIYTNQEHKVAIRGFERGEWKIVQNSFNPIIFDLEYLKV